MSSGLSVFLFQTLSPSPSPPSLSPPPPPLTFSALRLPCKCVFPLLPPLSSPSPFLLSASVSVCLLACFFYTFTSHHPAPPVSVSVLRLRSHGGRKCFQEKHKKDSVLSFFAPLCNVTSDHVLDPQSRALYNLDFITCPSYL